MERGDTKLNALGITTTQKAFIPSIRARWQDSHEAGPPTTRQPRQRAKGRTERLWQLPNHCPLERDYLFIETVEVGPLDNHFDGADGVGVHHWRLAVFFCRPEDI